MGSIWNFLGGGRGGCRVGSGRRRGGFKERIVSWRRFFRPFGAVLRGMVFTHGLRRGLSSWAPSELSALSVLGISADFNEML